MFIVVKIILGKLDQNILIRWLRYTKSNPKSATPHGMNP